MSLLSFYRPTTRKRLISGEAVPWIENNRRPNYAKRCVLSFPPWQSKREIKELVEACQAANRRCRGVRYELDHIIPIGGKLVSGLSVPWNLQIITKKSNKNKGNRLTRKATSLILAATQK